MSGASQTSRLLQASVDEDDDSYLRFLVNGKSIRYVIVAAGLYSTEDLCFGPTITSLLPTFPPGDWNHGHITRNPQTGQPHFSQTIKKQLQGVENIWHPTSVDYLDLAFGNKLRSGVYEVTCAKLRGTVIAKFARFEWEIDAVDEECAAYQWLDGKNIGPKFLGHIAEEGRVIGFLMEEVADARHATIEDLAACSESLGRLHRLGIVHGDTNKYNFLINAGGVTMIDFECARRSDDERSFEVEMGNLAGQLQDDSGRGGCFVEAAAEGGDLG
jgi:serine/threonine protein kinase